MAELVKGVNAPWLDILNLKDERIAELQAENKIQRDIISRFVPLDWIWRGKTIAQHLTGCSPAPNSVLCLAQSTGGLHSAKALDPNSTKNCSKGSKKL